MLEALEAAGAYRATSLSAPRGTEDDEHREPRRHARRPTTGASSSPSSARRSTDCCRRSRPREREVLRLRFQNDMTQAEIGERIGVSQMQVSRLIRQTIGRLRAAAQVPD